MENIEMTSGSTLQSLKKINYSRDEYKNKIHIELQKMLQEEVDKLIDSKEKK